MPLKDPEKRREHDRKYRLTHREELCARHREYYAKNGERVRAKRREYYAKNREQERAGFLKYYREHKEEWRARAASYTEENLNLLLAVGIDARRCSICGYDACVNAIDAHHVNPSEKEAELGKLIRHAASVEKKFELLDEASKCIFVCANCHRMIHAGLIDMRGASVCASAIA